jgi:phosphoglycerate dehydrogenase-like enzyme
MLLSTWLCYVFFMSQHTILITSKGTGPRADYIEQLEREARVIVGNNPEAFAEAAPEATVMLNWSAPRELNRSAFLMAPKLAWVHSRNAGLDSFLFSELVESPVTLTNGSGVFSPPLGEFVLAAMLYFAKDFRRMIRNQVAAKWEPFDVLRLAGQTVGIVGYGDIGREVAWRAKAMGMNIFALKRHLPPPGSDLGPVDKMYSTGELREMIAACDYVVVAAPLTAETHHLISAAEFAAMKPDAVIINVGRGPVIDEAAMVRALAQERIKGAGLDVFEHEPLSSESPLYRMENVLVSPHCADNTPDWLDNAMKFFIAQLNRFEKGEPLQNIVDKKLGY